MTQLHPDWPADGTPHDWSPYDDWGPYDDIRCALAIAQGPHIPFEDIVRVERYWFDSNNGSGPPAGWGGSELQFYLTGQLTDGRWFSLEGGNDYTGWGCQDGADTYIGATEDDVVANGCTVEARSRLGYPALAGASSGGLTDRL